MNLKIDLEALKNDDGYYSESDVKALERATGMEWADIVKNDEAQAEPEGNPATWTTDKKLSYIKEHGRKAYEKALRHG
ncbi:hypothetical protein DYD21_10100 [Rhodohalobacter sp. SW132]|uniref:hypothetical protein n=1 Tax=Rhodohalobacter sp. SW132 TaxID=2293433 RepID=UPI000E278179|nr:hypothetical protein [Rhodohalobacter sp. SW132]REL33748.1 hypothetical protein DYD21_10100 [Rhodohalobacter sp. SW132]